MALPLLALRRATLAAPDVTRDPFGGQGLSLDPNGEIPESVRKRVSGYVFSRKTFTSDVTVTATVRASADTVVASGSVTLDGSTSIEVDVYSAQVVPGTTWIQGTMWEDSTDLGIIGEWRAQTPCRVGMSRTPAAGIHTYTFKAFVDAGSGLIRGASPYIAGMIVVRKA